MSRLQGKIALITGAGAGIGYAIAEAFLAEGASVVLTDINGESLEAAKARLGYPEHVRSIRANAAVAADWERAVAVAEGEFGGLDILVNNAGIEVMGTAETVDESTWDRIMAVNVKGPYLGVRAAISLLRRSSGNIINIASTGGLIGAPGWIAYISSKHALVGMTKCLALDYARDGIRANAICPGIVETPMADRIVQTIGHGDATAGHQALAAGIPLGRFIEPEEVAAVAVHLASEEARFTTGTTYVIDGGATSSR